MYNDNFRDLPKYLVRFQSLTAASVKITDLWNMEPNSFVEVERCFRDPSSGCWWSLYARLKPRSTTLNSAMSQKSNFLSSVRIGIYHTMPCILFTLA
jgi:hypothetical protein